MDKKNDPIAVSPFCVDLGIELLEWQDGRAVLALEVTPRLTNRRGAAHGGVVASLADHALSMAWRSAAPERTGAGTISLNVNFVAPAKGRLRAEGRLVRLTGSCAFCEGHIFGGDGKLVATAQAAFRVRQKPTPDAAGAAPGGGDKG